jgi:hypothetical protein
MTKLVSPLAPKSIFPGGAIEGKLRDSKQACRTTEAARQEPCLFSRNRLSPAHHGLPRSLQHQFSSLGHSTAQHDYFRIQCAYDVGQGKTEIAASLMQNLLRTLITTLCKRREITGADHALQLPLRLDGDTSSRRMALQASYLCILGQEFITYRHPAQAAGQFVVPANEMPIHENAGAYTRADGHKDDITAIAGRAFPGFAHHKRVAVAFDNNRKSETPSQYPAKRLSLPLPDIRSPHIAVAICQAGNIDAKRHCFVMRNLLEQPEKLIYNRRATFRRRSRFEMMTDAPAPADSGYPDVRTAYIGGQDKIRHAVILSVADFRSLLCGYWRSRLTTHTSPGANFFFSVALPGCV